MPKRVLITGSNRGIGLEFVRQYLENGWMVYATCRRPAEANALHMLADLYSELHIYPLDVTDREDIMDIRLELRDIPLDFLINNAGVYFEKANADPEAIHYDDWLRTIEVNTIGPFRITAAFLDNIAKSDRKLVVVISSTSEKISISRSWRILLPLQQGGSQYGDAGYFGCSQEARNRCSSSEPRRGNDPYRPGQRNFHPAKR